MRLPNLALLAFVWVGLLSSAYAVQPDEIMADPAKESRARDLSRELRCMVCQNQSIDDSEAPLARDLRLLVRERIAAGDSDGQGIDFLGMRYGEFVLLKPRLERHTLLLWLLPPLALAGGGLAPWSPGPRRPPRPIDFPVLEIFLMTDPPPDLSPLPPAHRRSLFSARKLALMASVVAGLGIAAYGFSPSPTPVDIFSPAHAQVNNEVRKVEKPDGFADIVQRVKPSVISVEVHITEKVAKDDSSNNDDSPSQPGSPMERFFRRFGGPDGLPPGLRGGPRGGGRGVVTGQGSGFFISPDGYAVTNNHVVDGSDKVEVTADDGKIYSAKGIGTDAGTHVRL